MGTTCWTLADMVLRIQGAAQATDRSSREWDARNNLYHTCGVVAIKMIRYIWWLMMCVHYDRVERKGTLWSNLSYEFDEEEEILNAMYPIRNHFI